ncbi:MAG: hypothetical protein JXR84_03565 [Anaerolineae bacterium]|nr:hypothetical protein [Anaerolineae bacterium]
MARLKTLFENWLAPLVNLETTLLLFATFIFHRFYFGAAHPVTDLLTYDGMWIVYVYGAVVLLASLVNIPEDWQPLTAFMICIGGAFMSIAYIALFWVRPSTPSWSELLAQLYYVLQAVISLIQIILLVTQEPGTRFAVTPRLVSVPSALKALAILAYVAGMTLLLDRGFALAPDEVTAQVNLFGVGALEGLIRLGQWRHARIHDAG